MVDTGSPDAGVDNGHPPTPPPVDDGEAGGEQSPSPSETTAAAGEAFSTHVLGSLLSPP